MKYYFFGLMLIVSVYAAAMDNSKPVITSQEIVAAYAALAPNSKDWAYYKIENEKYTAYVNNNKMFCSFTCCLELKGILNNESDRYQALLFFGLSQNIGKNCKTLLRSDFERFQGEYLKQLEKISS